MYQNLRGQTALVTGAGKKSGIGYAIARKLAQNGADVVLASADKLLGGSQAGLILGRSELITRIGRHPSPARPIRGRTWRPLRPRARRRR